jgi:hypothetical protein
MCNWRNKSIKIAAINYVGRDHLRQKEDCYIPQKTRQLAWFVIVLLGWAVDRMCRREIIGFRKAYRKRRMCYFE